MSKRRNWKLRDRQSKDKIWRLSWRGFSLFSLTHKWNRELFERKTILERNGNITVGYISCSTVSRHHHNSFMLKTLAVEVVKLFYCSILTLFCRRLLCRQNLVYGNMNFNNHPIAAQGSRESINVKKNYSSNWFYCKLVEMS